MSRPRRSLQERAGRWLAVILLLINILAGIGFVLRDRNVALALMLYLPLPIVGAAALGLDLLCRGRALAARRGRYVLAGVGLTAMAGGGATMIAWGPHASAPANHGSAVRLLHWNVLWGGWPRGDATWDAMTATIVRHEPDIVVLSEAPPAGQIERLRARLGDGWSVTWIEHDSTRPNWYRLAVLARWPVRPGRSVSLQNGVALDARVEVPGQSLRLLVADGWSRITQVRTPFLHDLADHCRQAAAAGQPFDAVLGDFNAVGRSRGFDALRDAGDGYTLAADSSRGWRGTWPAFLPMYDIDHVWIRRALAVRACTLFTRRTSDHRGQVVTLAVPDLRLSDQAPAGRESSPRPPARPDQRALAPVADP